MTDPTIVPARHRIEPQPEETIDRSRAFAFRFNGREYSAHPGDTIASALAAVGVRVISRSFKYHRPRGLLCCSGHCPNCLVQVGDEPNVRACRRLVEPDMDVKPQNVWPSLDLDLMALTELGERMLPVGFYYKTFIRPQFLWPTYEQVLRRAAGLGKVSVETPPGHYDKRYLFADVAVVGGGPAGLSAAIAAAEHGAEVILFDDQPSVGGHLRFGSGTESAEQRMQRLRDLRAGVNDGSRISIYSDTTVFGWYEQNWLSAVRGSRLYKIRSRSVVFATGALEQPLLFDNNDLPGVMLGSGALRLLNLYGVAPGGTAVVVTANDDGWQVAASLLAAGVKIAGVVDERPGPLVPEAAQLTQAGTPIFPGHTILAARGSRAVQGAVVAPVDPENGVDADLPKTLACDLIVVSVGWLPSNGLLVQAGAELVYDESYAEFRPPSMPESVYAAGRVVGTHSLEHEVADGRLAGWRAAAYLGLVDPPGPEETTDLKERRASERIRTSARVSVPGKKKRFVCFCEDVTEKDIAVAIDEGYDRIELLKRYSTISMGPCQGAMCSLNAIHLCARATERSIQETGTTTARPPVTPVELGVLAGQHMEPVQVAPIHDWHLAHDARMMVAGLWLRPEHYGNPTDEVRAVRERVGLIDVSTLGKLRLSGPGVPDLLDRLYVNKWQKLAVGRVRYGVMCNDEGVVLDDGVTAHLAPDEWYTTTTSSGANAIYEWMQWWAQSGWGEGVHITALTESYAAFNLAGPKSRDLLSKLTDADISRESFPYMHVRSVDIAGVPCTVLRIGFTGELSYEIHCPAGYGIHLWEALMGAGGEFDIRPFGVEAQRVLRLEKAHIIIGQDTDATSDPLSADLDWVVKLDKADFLGHRSLQRIAAEGSPQRLVGFKMVEPDLVPAEGLQIVTSRPNGQFDIIGWVTSCRLSPSLGETIGLCWLPANIAERAGATFNIRMNGELKEARVHHGAFYDPEGLRLRM